MTSARRRKDERTPPWVMAGAVAAYAGLSAFVLLGAGIGDDADAKPTDVQQVAQPGNTPDAASTLRPSSSFTSQPAVTDDQAGGMIGEPLQSGEGGGFGPSDPAEGGLGGGTPGLEKPNPSPHTPRPMPTVNRPQPTLDSPWKPGPTKPAPTKPRPVVTKPVFPTPQPTMPRPTVPANPDLIVKPHPGVTVHPTRPQPNNPVRPIPQPTFVNPGQPGGPDPVRPTPTMPQPTMPQPTQPKPVQPQPGNGSGWLGELNRIRSSKGLSPVTEDPSLSAECVKHVAYMKIHGMQGHFESPGSQGYSPAGHKCAKESNLVSGARNELDSFRIWVGSPAHYAGMVRPGLKTVGFAWGGGYGALNVIAGLSHAQGSHLASVRTGLTE